jgi:hypothetical protein
MLKKIHDSKHKTPSNSTVLDVSTVIDKNEIANAFINFFGNEASVCLNDYFVYLEEVWPFKNLEISV